jgi:hypothetical protein
VLFGTGYVICGTAGGYIFWGVGSRYIICGVDGGCGWLVVA